MIKELQVKCEGENGLTKNADALHKTCKAAHVLLLRSLKGHGLEVWRGLLASALDRNEVRHGHRSHGVWLSFVAYGARADVDLGCVIERG